MDWKTTALVVIDMENAFISKESPLCIQEAAKSVPACGRVIRKARERGIPVFFVNRIYRRNGSDVEFTRYDSWLGGNRAADVNAPFGRGKLPCQHGKNCGFAAARRSDNGYKFARLDGKAQMRHSRGFSADAVVAEADILQRNNGVHGKDLLCRV